MKNSVLVSVFVSFSFPCFVKYSASVYSGLFFCGQNFLFLVLIFFFCGVWLQGRRVRRSGIVGELFSFSVFLRFTFL